MCGCQSWWGCTLHCMVAQSVKHRTCDQDIENPLLASYSHLCAAVTKQHLVLAKRWRCPMAEKVITGLVESNGSLLLGLWLIQPVCTAGKVTMGLVESNGRLLLSLLTISHLQADCLEAGINSVSCALPTSTGQSLWTRDVRNLWFCTRRILRRIGQCAPNWPFCADNILLFSALMLQLQEVTISNCNKFSYYMSIR